MQLLSNRWTSRSLTFTPTADSEPGDTYLLDVQLPDAVRASGLYDSTLSVQATFSDGSQQYATTSGTACQWALQNQPLMGASKPASVQMFFSQGSSPSPTLQRPAYHVRAGLSAHFPSEALAAAVTLPGAGRHASAGRHGTTSTTLGLSPFGAGGRIGWLRTDSAS